MLTSNQYKIHTKYFWNLLNNYLRKHLSVFVSQKRLQNQSIFETTNQTANIINDQKTSSHFQRRVNKDELMLENMKAGFNWELMKTTGVNGITMYE